MAQELIFKNNHTNVDPKWIVHTHFGIGQIKGIDEKNISGEKNHYYRVKTKNSTFWVPIDDLQSETVRSLSAPEDIEQALVILQEPPEQMPPNAHARQNQIRKARQQNTPQAMAEIIRDLQGLKREKSTLNQAERSTLQKLKQCLAEEWALVLRIKAEQAILEIDALLG